MRMDGHVTTQMTVGMETSAAHGACVLEHATMCILVTAESSPAAEALLTDAAWIQKLFIRAGYFLLFPW